MRDELRNKINVALGLLNDLENVIFDSQREHYIIRKSIILSLIDGLKSAEKKIDMYSDDELLKTSNEVEELINAINSLSKADESVDEFSSDEIDELLNSLESDKFETVFPTGEIDTDILNTEFNSYNFEDEKSIDDYLQNTMSFDINNNE